jgi:6-phospho-beta-glucosidase
MKRSIARYLGVPGDEVYVDYFGLNHCGWIHRVLVEGRDRLPEILGSYEGLQRVDESWRLFDADLVRSIGMLPMEYLFFYYYREQAVDHVLRSGDTRGGQIAKLSAELWPVLRDRVEHDDIPGARRAWERAMDQRGSTYFARERGETVSERPHADDPSLGAVEGEGYEGVATAVMLAAVQRDPTPLILNVPNRGAVPSLGDRDVVEVTCLADQHGARPIAQGAIPDHAIALLEHVKLYERLTVDAAVRGSYDSALRALLVHPLVGSYPVAKSILEDYLTRHDGLMPPLR